MLASTEEDECLPKVTPIMRGMRRVGIRLTKWWAELLISFKLLRTIIRRRARCLLTCRFRFSEGLRAGVAFVTVTEHRHHAAISINTHPWSKSMSHFQSIVVDRNLTAAHSPSQLRFGFAERVSCSAANTMICEPQQLSS